MIEGWHLEAVCLHLEAVTRGDITRLLINIPPGHAKSLLVCVLWPAWVWIQRPEWRGLFASYDKTLSVRDSIRMRTLIESRWYQETFVRGKWSLRADQNRVDDFSNTLSGRRLAISVGGKGTGERGNAVIVDDPLNAKDAMSKAARDEVIYWYDKVMPTRVDDPQKAAFVVIMQRLHEDDLAGHILARGGYQHLCLPAEFESKRRSKTFRVDGSYLWQDPRREDGELLFPDMFPKAVLDELRTQRLGSDGYAGQFQQRPTAIEGGMFKRNWWRFWKPDGTAADTCPRPLGCYDGPAMPLPRKLDSMLISVDCSFKATASGSRVSMLVVGVQGANRYLLANITKPMTFSETLVNLRYLCAQYPRATKKLIEDKANGSAVIDTLKNEITGIIAVNPEGGKEARASAIQPTVESGNVYLPDGAAWVDGFVEELAVFPNGSKDDQVDSLSQALIDLQASPAMTRAIALSKL